MTMYGSNFWFAHNAVHNIPHNARNCIWRLQSKSLTFYNIILHKKTFAKTPSTLLVKSTNNTTYFKCMELGTTYQWSRSVCLSSQTRCNEHKKTTVLIMRRTRENVVHSKPFADANRDGDTRSCPGTAVHASGLPPNRSHPWVKILLASRTCLKNCRHGRKKVRMYPRASLSCQMLLLSSH